MPNSDTICNDMADVVLMRFLRFLSNIFQSQK